MAVNKRKNFSFFIILITYIFGMIFRIIMTKIIGSKGAAYFSVPNEVFFLLGGMFCYGMEEAVASMVENRMFKQQYANAKKVFRIGAIFSFILGIIISIILFIIRSKITNSIFHMQLSFMAFEIVLLTIPFIIFAGALRGYFKGTGNNSVSVASKFIFALCYAVMGTIMSSAFLRYGQKVSALLKIEDYKYSYGALGAACGIVFATLVTFIHIVVMYILMKNRTIYSRERDFSKTLDYTPNIIINLLATALVPTLFFAIYSIIPLLNVVFLSHRQDAEFSMDFSLGEYYGKTYPINLLAVYVIASFSFIYIRKAIIAVRKEEYRTAREKLGRMIHRCATIAIFTTTMLMILADNILSTIYLSNGEATGSYLQIGAISITFILFGIIFMEIMINMQRYSQALVISAIAFGIHTILLVLFVAIFKMSIRSVLFCDLLFYIIVSAGGFMLVSRAFQYTQEWFRTFAVTLISALISALLGLVLNKALINIMGNLLSMVIVIVFCTLIYIVILLALKGYQEDELEDSILGKFMLALGKTFKLI